MPRGNRHEHPPSLIFRIFLENGGLWRSHSESQATPMAAQRSFTLNDSSTITPANLYTIPQLHGATRFSALASLCALGFLSRNHHGHSAGIPNLRRRLG